MNRRQIRMAERAGRAPSRGIIDNVGLAPWRRYPNDPVWRKLVKYLADTLLA